jgi:hypothetical protein
VTIVQIADTKAGATQGRRTEEIEVTKRSICIYLRMDVLVQHRSDTNIDPAGLRSRNMFVHIRATTLDWLKRRFEEVSSDAV